MSRTFRRDLVDVDRQAPRRPRLRHDRGCGGQCWCKVDKRTEPKFSDRRRALWAEAEANHAGPFYEVAP